MYNENKEDKEKSFFKEYTFDLKLKIDDIKNKILKDIGNFNYLNLENITERVYKDYGKLFFDLGVLPNTIDNYLLEQFTDRGRVFSFLALPCNIDKVIKKDNNEGFLKKIIKENREKNNVNNEFVYYEDDFPPLK